ncbi:hypothetical protein V1514DRAFT_305477 [Lipomyces japonicus]|uniref:uncharacterized protein n=1 Tax=Lipomyces japonicus TaxID=56871 RepID=UPI0034CF4773
MASHKEGPPKYEAVLRKHYIAFASFLNVPPDFMERLASPNQAKSRDRLHRMPRGPFVELSTDVYDELQRRIALRNGVSNIPSALTSLDEFNVRRNATRANLGSVQEKRFIDLLSDVFYELVKRLPIISSSSSSFSSSSSSSFHPSSIPGMQLSSPPPPRQQNKAQSQQSQSQSPTPPSPLSTISSIASSIDATQGKPVPRKLQTNTIIPAELTIVEDSDDSGNNHESSSVAPLSPTSVDDHSLLKPLTTRRVNLVEEDIDEAFRPSPINVPENSTASNNGLQNHSNITQQETYSGLQRQLDELLVQNQGKDDEIKNLSDALATEKSLAVEANKNLNDELFRSNASNKKLVLQIEFMETELEKLKIGSTEQQNQNKSTKDYADLRSKYEQLLLEHSNLNIKLKEQKTITDQIQTEALKLVADLKSYSSVESTNRQEIERLNNQIRKLQQENFEIQERVYHNIPLNKLSIPDRSSTPDRSSPSSSISQFVTESGKISSFNLFKFQSNIDGFIKLAPSSAELEFQSDFFEIVRTLITTALAIVAEAAINENDPSLVKLRSKISTSANNLVIASKNHVIAGGLSPLSILDASVAGLSGSVVDLVRAVKIKDNTQSDV